MLVWAAQPMATCCAADCLSCVVSHSCPVVPFSLCFQLLFLFRLSCSYTKYYLFLLFTEISLVSWLGIFICVECPRARCGRLALHTAWSNTLLSLDILLYFGFQNHGTSPNSNPYEIAVGVPRNDVTEMKWLKKHNNSRLNSVGIVDSG